MRAAVCTSPPVEAPHGLPSCRDLENEKSASYISLILSYIPVFVVSELFFSKRFAHIPRTYVYIYACHRLCVNFVDVSHLFSRNLRRKGVSHFFSGKFPRPCAMYVRLLQAPSFFLLLTILIMVFHQRWSLQLCNRRSCCCCCWGGGGLRQFFYSLYICEHVLFVLQSIFVVVCTFHTHLI